MATDKSINIRQVEATEKLAVALTEIERKMAELKAGLDEVKALLSKPETKFQQANREVSNRQRGGQ